jgi:hypothetical protein
VSQCTVDLLLKSRRKLRVVVRALLEWTQCCTADMSGPIWLLACVERISLLRVRQRI